MPSLAVGALTRIFKFTGNDMSEEKQKTALEMYHECDGNEIVDSLWRLRFFCWLAMNAQDWMDCEKFFNDIIAERNK